MSTQQITYVGFQLGALVKAMVSKRKKEEARLLEKIQKEGTLINSQKNLCKQYICTYDGIIVNNMYKKISKGLLEIPFTF